MTRDKKAIRKKVNSVLVDFTFRNAIYIIDPIRVQNYKDIKGTLKGAELIFYEDNPNPITGKITTETTTEQDNKEDSSGKYLDEIVIINFIQQTTDTFKNWNPDLGFLKWFMAEPSRIPMFLMFGLVAYTLLRNYLMSGMF